MLSFTIITPSFNQGEFIERTLQSVYAQNYPRLQYLVIDGGSTDQTLDILRRQGDRIEWISEPDEGQSDAINKGFDRATGDVIGWLCSDDTLRPGALHAVAAYLEQHPDVEMVVGDGWNIDAYDRPLRFYRVRPFNVRRFIAQGASDLMQPACFWRRSVLQKVGKLDTTLQYAMDYDFFIRIGLQCKVGYLPQALSNTRMHGDCKTVSGWDATIRACKEIRARYLRGWQERLMARYYDGRLWLVRQKFLWTQLRTARQAPPDRPLRATSNQ